jgi:hypothetical protein
MEEEDAEIQRLEAELAKALKARDRLVRKESVLVSLLEEERNRRVSPDTQAKMALAETSVDSEWMDVATAIQNEIVAEQNAKNPAILVSVLDLRLAAGRHPDIAFWEKYNRARVGELNVGGVAPNVPLFRARDNQKTSLLGDGQRCVVMAGSWS